MRGSFRDRITLHCLGFLYFKWSYFNGAANVNATGSLLPIGSRLFHADLACISGGRSFRF